MIIFDVESNGLLDDATKIHCLSFVDTKAEAPYDDTVITYHDYDDMRTLLKSATHLAGHNIIRYDIPLLEKILDIKIDARLYDTLSMFYKRPEAKEDFKLFDDLQRRMKGETEKAES